MKCVVQRVTRASVIVNDEIVSSIGSGLLVLVGVDKGDDEKEIQQKADKIITMRIFSDSTGKTNYSVKDIHGEIMLVSQFTLSANFQKGNRPSFDTAEKPDRANELFNIMGSYIHSMGFVVQCGIFGADMSVCLVNQGPFTVIL